MWSMLSSLIKFGAMELRPPGLFVGLVFLEETGEESNALAPVSDTDTSLASNELDRFDARSIARVKRLFA